MSRITPTIGRIVWFHPARIPDGILMVARENGMKTSASLGVGPLAAIVTHVWSDVMINLTVFEPNGETHGQTSVTLIDEAEGDIVPLSERYATWMPYQKTQAAKHASV